MVQKREYKYLEKYWSSAIRAMTTPKKNDSKQDMGERGALIYTAGGDVIIYSLM